MIFVDSNVFVYAVGRSHPLRAKAQRFFLRAKTRGEDLVTSAEVLQELLHVYLPVGRLETLAAAMELATAGTERVLPVTADDVLRARILAASHPRLTARDLIRLSVCRTHGIRDPMTFDRPLLEAFGTGSQGAV